MLQTTLHKYFAPHPPPPSRDAPTPKVTFSHLPFSVRRQIYAYAGLPEGLAVSLNYCPPEGVCPQTLRGYRPGLNHLPSEDDCPEIYRNPYDDLPENARMPTRSQSLLYFLVGLFPHPAPRAHRIVRITGAPFVFYSSIDLSGAA